MDKLLERQLRRHFPSGVPAALQPFVDDVRRTYREADDDRRFIERSLELTSQELMQANADLRAKQREQQVIFDSVPAMIIYKDAHNRILRLNEMAAKALGGSAAELEGKPTSEVLPKEVADALHQDDLKVIRSGQASLGIEETHPTADGVAHWMRTDKVPYLDADGKVVGVVVFSVDITQRKLAEQRLRDSEEQHRLIVETATEGIWTVDPQGRTLFANAVMAQMLGVKPGGLAGRTVFDFMAPSELAAGRAVMDELAKGHSVAQDLHFVRRDGADLWVQASAAPMRDRSGQVVGALGMMTDITKRRRAEQDLQAAYAQLQQVDRDRRQFLNNAAHELGTPLTPIRLQIHLLRNRMRQGGRDVGEVRAVDILDRNFERLGRLVRDLLDSARLQAESMKLHRAPVDLRDIVYSSVETYIAPAAEASVELEVGELPPLPVECDMSRISQVMDNLLSNAVKFTPAGAKVFVDAEVHERMARVRVRDEGMGMRREDLARLFQPFSQLHDTMQSTKGGTGLGLYISQGLVAAHGGSIHADSPGLGGGATFWFELPLRGSAKAPSPPAATGASVAVA